MSSSTWTSLHISLSLNLGAGLSNQGVAIVSEFISSARVMRGALIVNPWKVEEVSGKSHSVRLEEDINLLKLCCDMYSCYLSTHLIAIVKEKMGGLHPNLDNHLDILLFPT